MKDRQVEQSPAQLRIPFLSAFLHCISMTAIVFLRCRFGYVYLRPKSVFFAFSWAFVLFTVYGWYEAKVWRKTWMLCLYGSAAVILYWLHLAIAFFSELYGKGKHDNDSGTSHFLRILRWRENETSAEQAMNLQIWGEPLFVLTAGLVLHWPFGERYLSAWLMFVAPCLCAKECLNFWFLIRHKKKHKDSMEDAQDTLDDNVAGSTESVPVAARKDKIRRTRNITP